MRAEQAELDARLAEARVLTLKSQEQLTRYRSNWPLEQKQAQVLNQERGQARTGTSAACNWLGARPSLLSVQQQGKWLQEQITTQTDRGLVMTLGDMLFDSGEAELKAPANRTVLRRTVPPLNPKRIVRIEGYTGQYRPTKQYKLQLVADRAQAVAEHVGGLRGRRQAMQVEGFTVTTIRWKPMLQKRGRAQNRPVEIVFPTIRASSVTRVSITWIKRSNDE
ncbi:hypothetical protein FQR65_LT18040 [Abscondita terminalis]|nr:hypothetical protein FQR65_LT18040 [Abscondita terminalis]